MKDIAFLSDTAVFKGVGKTLETAGSGISSVSRRQRSLSKRRMWNASEWKHFIVCTSMVALDQWIPEGPLEGWWIYVQLCGLTSRRALSNGDINAIRRLSVRFVEHFMKLYYGGRLERVRHCRYVFHLLLHLADNIAQCGPLSNLAQWPMEYYIGELNRRSHAKTNFSRSFAQNVKHESAAWLYSVIYNVDIQFLASQTDLNSLEEGSNLSLQTSSKLKEFEGVKFLHPRTDISIESAKMTTCQNIRELLVRYYRARLTISAGEAEKIFVENDTMVLWDRMYSTSAQDHAAFLYRECDSGQDRNSNRPACYVAGQFYMEENVSGVYYGNVIRFIEHKVNGDTFMLALVGWITAGLHKGRQGRVFAKYGRDHHSLFRSITVEEVNALLYPVSAIEAIVPSRSTVPKRRTYFIDEMRETLGLLSSSNGDMKLMEISKKRSRGA